jgi:hypothetical protein
MKPLTTINEILDALTSQQQHGETSLIVTIDPALIPEATQALRSYRTLFAPVIAGQTDTAPIYATYERMRHAADPAQQTILLLVECQTMDQLHHALDRLPIRKSSEWRSSDDPDFWDRYFQSTNDPKAL